MSTLAELLDTARQRTFQTLRVALPARVEAYDATKQSASVQPLVREAFETEEGFRATERLPVVADVPVAWPTGGGAFLSFPLAAGDTGLLVFSDRSLDVWLARGGEVDPVDGRMHHLADAVFFPGLVPFASPRTGVSASDVVLSPGGHAVLLGGVSVGTTQAALRAETFLDALSTLLTALGTAVPAMAAPIATFNTAAEAFLSTTVRTG